MRTLTELEVQHLEGLARRTRIDEMLSFFELLPRQFHIPRPLLLGSNNAFEVLAEGLASRTRIVEELRCLDEPFNPHVPFSRTLMHQPRDRPLPLEQAIRRELSNGLAKICLASALGACRGKIVRAHSLQQASFESHARKGHVYEFDRFRFHPATPIPTLVGVNDATTFTGFCAHHDSSLFRPIETKAFDALDREFFLHHYRALAQALYAREWQWKPIETAVTKTAPEMEEVSRKRLEERNRLTTTDAEEIRRHKKRCEQHLLSSDWGAIEGHAWRGEGAPEVFATDFLAPSKDFAGRPLQDCKSTGDLEWLSLTLTASGDRPLVLLCGQPGSRVLRQCAESLDQIPCDRRTKAVVVYVVCQLENFIMMPDWWDRLPAHAKARIGDAWGSHYFPRSLPIPSDWKLRRIR